MEDRNKLHHIFGNPDHNLDALVDQFGNREVALSAIVEAVDRDIALEALSAMHSAGIDRY